MKDETLHSFTEKLATLMKGEAYTKGWPDTITLPNGRKVAVQQQGKGWKNNEKIRLWVEVNGLYMLKPENVKAPWTTVEPNDSDENVHLAASKLIGNVLPKADELIARVEKANEASTKKQNAFDNLTEEFSAAFKAAGFSTDFGWQATKNGLKIEALYDGRIQFAFSVRSVPTAVRIAQLLDNELNPPQEG